MGRTWLTKGERGGVCSFSVLRGEIGWSVHEEPENDMRARVRTRRVATKPRRTLSLPEGLLWRALKGRRLEGLQIRKQHPIGPYVLDFYCDSRRLCVEVDGASHGVGDRPERDERRDAWLETCGIATLRIRAGFVLEDMDGALGMILSAAKERPAADPLRHAPAARATSPGPRFALGRN